MDIDHPSEKKIDSKEQKAREKAAYDANHRALEENKIAQAESRLKYLLSQSDMFAHFGVGKGTSNSKASALPTSPQAKPSSRRAKHGVGEEEEELMEGCNAGTVLTSQPTILQGQLKHYQLEGLNWLIRLQENGINGILADEMGLGKTFQSISILAYTKEYRKISGPHLIGKSILKIF
jgi:SWI/SNF-related matrix-associated actin-dependent regulator of chromatin subfamily A member 5